METALRLITAANGGKPVPVHVNYGMFVRRATPGPGGGLLPMGEVPSPDRLRAAGGAYWDAQPEDGLAPSGDPVEGVDTVTTRQVGRDTTEAVRR